MFLVNRLKSVFVPIQAGTVNTHNWLHKPVQDMNATKASLEHTANNIKSLLK